MAHNPDFDLLRFQVRLTYSTVADNPRDAAKMIFFAVNRPGSMVCEVFTEAERNTTVEFDGEDLCAIAQEALGCPASPPITCPETGEVYTVAQHKLAAIRARIMGVWDHPALLRYGPLSTDTNTDVIRILDT